MYGEGRLRTEKYTTQDGVERYSTFMHGNRDFMVASNFAKRTGVVLLPDPTVVTLGGVRTLLAHGDRYCTGDLVYQAFRAKSRTDAWQSRTLRYPLFIRRWTARRGRRKSMALQAKGKASGVIADVVDAALIPEMNALGVTRLIHGHTHRPAEHEVSLAAGKGERIVLADWREEGEALEVLCGCDCAVKAELTAVRRNPCRPGNRSM